MRVKSVESCCTGTQFLDFPNAHFEGVKTDKQTIIELLNLMYLSRGMSFYYAFVNMTQNMQMEKIFKFLGWKKHNCGGRVYAYICEKPTDWFREHGFGNYVKYLEPKSHYTEYNSRADAEREELRPAREKFLEALKKNYSIEASELTFSNFKD